MVTIQSQNFGVEIEMTGVSRGTAASVIANYFGVGGIHFAGGTYQTYEAKDSKGRVYDLLCCEHGHSDCQSLSAVLSVFCLSR